MEKIDPIPTPEPTDDERADAVIAADDTGIVSGEHEIVNAEIEQALAQLE